MNRNLISKALGSIIFSSRWMLYPINIGLLVGLAVYVAAFLYHDYVFISTMEHFELEHIMIALLGLVDAAMVANLIIMIVQGGHQIFIYKFESMDRTDVPEYLEHIDSGILKIKIALSISSITLVQILKDFVHIDKVSWDVSMHRMAIHGMTLLSALVMAVIWRISHPPKGH